MTSEMDTPGLLQSETVALNVFTLKGSPGKYARFKRNNSKF